MNLFDRAQRYRLFHRCIVLSVFLSLLLACSSTPEHSGSLASVDLSNQIMEHSLQNVDLLIRDGHPGQALARCKQMMQYPIPRRYLSRVIDLVLQSCQDLGITTGIPALQDLRQEFESLKDTGYISFHHQLRQTVSELPTSIPYADSSSVVSEDPTSSHSALNGKSLPNVTNSFYETDLRQALLDITMQTRIPIIWDETVEGTVTYEAVDSPVEEVLHDILFSTGYAYRYRRGAYYVGSSKVEDPSFYNLSETRTMMLSNTSAQEATGLLSEYFKPYVTATDQSNIVCITAPGQICDRILEDLKAIDRPRPQIEIEAMIIELSTTKLKEIGLNWQWITDDASDTQLALNIATTEMNSTVLLLDYIRDNLKFKDRITDVYGVLQALSDEGVAKVRATPCVRTMNGHTATLSTLKEQYFFITSGGSGDGGYLGYYSRLETIRSGIHLEITPYADSTGYITVNVKPEVDDVIGQGANGLPEISRRHADTTIRVRDGETISIGGLRLQDNRTLVRKVPLLGDIPILGRLFSRTETERVERELLIFITPHVIAS